MAELKTQENDGNVLDYLNTVVPIRRRDDSMVLLDLMGRATGLTPRLWGDSIVGFGAYDYTYKSGRSGRWFLTGFAPRRAKLSVYIMPGFGRYGDDLARLGPHSHSVSCLYITRLDAIDQKVLAHLVAKSVDDMRAMYDA